MIEIQIYNSSAFNENPIAEANQACFGFFASSSQLSLATQTVCSPKVYLEWPCVLGSLPYCVDMIYCADRYFPLFDSRNTETMPKPVANKSSSLTDAATTDFPKLPQLPLEIRRAIWRQAALEAYLDRYFVLADSQHRYLRECSPDTCLRTINSRQPRCISPSCLHNLLLGG